MDTSALNLASPEVRVEAECETSNPVDVMAKKLETNSLVEEFMLLVKIGVTRRIYKCFPQIAIIRHPPSDVTEIVRISNFYLSALSVMGLLQ